mmetsp:Transcript_17369/g.20854  ORF Transcript_17369/g.20854 Transcript_17369/m.20854 type:complete len:201 (-) Transcript_17369:60-662(-)
MFLSAIVVCSYFAFYTAYNKKTKALSGSLLLDVLFVRRSLDFTLVELNKAISLAGLTLLCIAFAVGGVDKEGTIRHAMLMLWIHSIYSIYKYYGSKMMPKLQRLKGLKLPRLGADGVESMKLTSLIAGTMAQLMLSVTFYCIYKNHDLSLITPLGLTSVALGTAHFYTMEIDYKGVLQVRPYAFLPFGFAAAAFGKSLLS